MTERVERLIKSLASNHRLQLEEYQELVEA